MAGWFLLSFAGLALSGCTVAHMALPEGTQSASRELPVEGLGLLIVRNYFDFAPYRVTDVRKGWTKGQGWSIGGYSSSKAKQKYEFSVTEPGRATWDVICTARADWNKADLQGFLGNGVSLEFSYDRSLDCLMKQEGDEKVSRLFMAQSASELVMNGIMKVGATRIDIAVTYNFDFTPVRSGDPTGYIFSIGDRFVGAVEVINMGTVWMHNAATPETRSAVAVASAVLLMHQDIKEMMEKS